MILAPVIAGRKGEQADLLDELRAQGFTRVRIDGVVYELDATPRLAKNVKHSVDVVVDRLRVRADARQRLAESLETALRHADGKVVVIEVENGTGASFFGALFLPGVRLRGAGARAATFLVQQPGGRMPALRRPRYGGVLRPEAHRRASEPLARKAARSAAGTAGTSSISPCCSRSPGTTASISRPRGRCWTSASRSSSCTVPEMKKSLSATCRSAAAPR